MAIFARIVVLFIFALQFVAILASDWYIPDILEKPEVDVCEGNLANCYCTSRVIDCNGAELDDITAIYPYITVNTSRVSITGGRIDQIPDRLFVTGKAYNLDKLTFLDLSNNHIQSMAFKAFHNLPNLKYLDLSNNNINMDLCEAKRATASPFANLKHLEVLKLHQSFNVVSHEWPCEVGNLFYNSYLPRLNTLDLSSNGFSVYGKVFTNFLCNNSVSLTRVNFGGNKFQRFLIPVCMENLVSLDFSGNDLEFLTPIEMDIIESFLNLEEMKLEGNPFRCDCAFVQTQDWMNTTDRPLDIKKIKCSNGSFDAIMVGKPVLSVILNATEICEEPRIIVCFGPLQVHMAKTTFIAILASCMLLMAGIAGLVVFCHRKRRKSGAVRVPTEGPKVPPYDRMA